MANFKLYKSSIICTLIYINTFIYFEYYTINHKLIKLIYSGLITSILNHGLTLYYIKIIDRLIISCGFIYTLYLLITYYDIIKILLLIISILLFFLSKILQITLLHIFSHFILTFIHIQLLIQYINL